MHHRRGAEKGGADVDGEERASVYGAACRHTGGIHAGGIHAGGIHTGGMQLTPIYTTDTILGWDAHTRRVTPRHAYTWKHMHMEMQMHMQFATVMTRMAYFTCTSNCISSIQTQQAYISSQIHVQTYRQPPRVHPKDIPWTSHPNTQFVTSLHIPAQQAGTLYQAPPPHRHHHHHHPPPAHENDCTSARSTSPNTMYMYVRVCAWCCIHSVCMYSLAPCVCTAQFTTTNNTMFRTSSSSSSCV